MSNKSKATFFDGKKPIPHEGLVSLYSQYLIFNTIDSSSDNEEKIFYKDIFSIKKQNGSIHIEITETKNKSSQRLIIDDGDFYVAIMEKWKSNNKSFFTKTAITFESLHIRKKVLLIFSLVPLAAFITYLVLYQSYTLIPHSIDNELGLAISNQFVKDQILCTNKKLTQTMTSIIQMVTPKNSAYEYKVFVVKEDIPNAFALPNGHIYIFSGLLSKSNSPDEVAGVLAHEISHVERRHGMQRMVRILGVAFIIKSIVGAGFEEAELAEFISEIVNVLIYFKYSQDFEEEADHDAITYLHNSKMSAKGLVSFFEKLDQIEVMPEQLSWLSTHPSNKKRIDYIKKEIGAEKITGNPLHKYRYRWNAIKKCY